MRPFPLTLALLASTLASGSAAFAADRTPSAIRARQIYGTAPGRTVRPVQDGGDSGGPRLLKPSIEPLPDSDAPVDTTPTPTFEPPAATEPDRSVVPFAPDSLGPAQRRPAPIPRIVGSAPPCPVEANDFWIVSSRNCIQQGNRTSASCPLDYYRCDRGNRRVAKDENEFRRSIPPGVPVCIVVHGSFTDWDTVCADAAATQRWLRAAAPHLPVQIVLFSWPSEPTTVLLPPVDTGIMGTRAEFNDVYLSQLIQRIPAESPVSMIGHSHGARAISSTLHLMGGGIVQGYRYPNPQAFPHRVRVVFMAGALDHHWLDPGERYGRALPRIDALLNVRNCQDWALAFYEWRRPFAGAALGKDGLYNEDRRRLGELNSKIREVDVSRLLGTNHLWPSYIRRPEIATAAVPYVYFEGDVTGGQVPLVPNSVSPTGPSGGFTPNPGSQSPDLGAPAAQPTFEELPSDVSRYRPATPGSTTPQGTARFAPAPGDPFRQPGVGQTPSNVRQPAGNPLSAQPASNGVPGTLRTNVPPTNYGTGRYPASPQGAGVNGAGAGRTPPTRTPPNPATLLPPQSSIGPRSPAQGSPLHPIEPDRTFPTRIDPPAVTKTSPSPNPLFRSRGNDGCNLNPLPRLPETEPLPTPSPGTEETHPVHVDDPPRDAPRFRLPTIIRKFYPEAMRSESSPEI
ncbi:MAG: alpha/beta hydrolase [Planctomycetaceae bacterium]|nr:alpha/beta hydrolase [Planctomycetaceae bacterium]